MKRRRFTTATLGAGAAVTLASTFPAPAIAERRYEWRMVTTWPKGLPGLGVGAERFAERVRVMSEGRLRIEVFGAGELVPAFESFDAVTSGTAQLMHATPYYWQGKHPALNFFTSAPYALLAEEHDAWMSYGGGQELWDELYDRFGLKGWNVGNTGTQMTGWFPREIHGLEDVRGLSFRTAGLGTEVWRRVGLNVQTLPAAEIFPALQAGSLDAAGWIGPWNDLALGLHRIHKLYYYPSIIEPSTAPEVAVDKSAYAALPEELQRILEVAAGAELHRVLADFNNNNARALQTLVHEHGVQLRRLPGDVIEALARASAEVVGEIAAYDEIGARIVDSMAHFRDSAMRWTEVSSQAFAETRALPIPFPA